MLRNKNILINVHDFKRKTKYIKLIDLLIFGEKTKQNRAKIIFDDPGQKLQYYTLLQTVLDITIIKKIN